MADAWTILRPGGLSFLWRLGLHGRTVIGRASNANWMWLASHTYPAHTWYVPLLGVRPDAQGRGLSRAVLRPVFETADRDKLPIYLETVPEVNGAVYQKLGFVLRGYRELTGGLPNWEMVREPRDHKPVASMAAV